MRRNGKLSWEAMGVIVAVIVALVAGGWALAEKYDWFGTEPGFLDEPQPPPIRIPKTSMLLGLGMLARQPEPPQAFIPMGPNSATVINFQNTGGRELLVTQVRLHDYTWKRTPVREDIRGQAPPVRAIFDGRKFSGRREITLDLNDKRGVKPGEWVSVQVAIVWPEKAPYYTYVGSVTIVYDGNKTRTVKNVELDLLKTAPPPLPMP